MKPLTDKQRNVLNYLEKEIAEKKYPPSIRDICKALNLSSTSSAHLFLKILEEKGYIRRDHTKPRAIEVLHPNDENLYENNRFYGKNLPIIGEVAAGIPLLADENIEGYFPVSSDFFTGSGEHFILRVKGDSMINAGIFNCDLIIVHRQNDAVNGDIIVALLDDEATVKRFYRDNGKIKLQPENESFEPVYLDELTILGKVVGLFRRF